MNLKTVFVLSAVALVGCSSDTRDTKMKFEEAPLAVRLGIEKAFPDAKVKEVEKEVYKEDGTVHYEVKLVTKDRETKRVEFAPDGELLDKH